MKVKTILIILGVFTVFMILCNMASAKDNVSRETKEMQTKETQTSKVEVVTETKVEVTEKPVIEVVNVEAEKVKNNFINIKNKLVTDVFDSESQIIEPTKVDTIFGDQMDFKITFKDKSILVLRCKYDNNKSGYIIKSIK